jgi:ParB family chromosome partitioning protein
MQLANLNLDQLSISPLNMRHSKTPPDVSDMLPSVRQRGVIVPLLVRPNGAPDHFEVLAGRRRWTAAQAVREERGSFGPLPCAILEEGDDASAIETSMLENMYREAPDEMSEYESFAKMVKAGRDVGEIAVTFGLEPRQVEQRLALGNLLPKIRAAFRDDKIDTETIRSLTAATKRQQSEWLKMFEADDENTPFGSDIKHWLCGGRAVPTALALFPIEQYKGAILGDLFGDCGDFADADAFWELQNQAIAARRDDYLAAGWSEVVILDQGSVFHAWEHEKCPKRKGGKVFVQVSPRGEVVFHEGYVTRKEARRLAAKSDQGEGAAAVKGTAPELSSPMTAYLNLHKQIAVRAALLDAPDIAQRLVIIHAMKGSGLWEVAPERQHTGRDATDKSVAESPAQKVYLDRRAGLMGLLNLPENSGLVACHGDDTEVLFARVMALSDQDAARVLTFVMADSLEVGSEYVDLTGQHLGVNLAKTWAADDVFFDLLRDKRVINRIVAETAGKKVANANVSATGKVQKRIIEDCLIGANGRAKIENWVPRWLLFPAKRYLKS